MVDKATKVLEDIAEQFRQGSSTDSAVSLRLTCAADIAPEPVHWLWEGWLALGKLAILAGNPGSGKTTLALGLAATITTEGRWPDNTPCRERGSVVMWSGEDDPADTLIPRLMAAGADLSRVHFLTGVRDDGEDRSFDPGRDVAYLAAALEKIGDVRLIIIDPIVSAITGDGHKANDVRRSLQPIVDYAMKHDCAVIGITHFSKNTGGRNPLERVTGSQAFGALARVVMVAANEEGDSSIRVLARAKSNIGPDGGGVSYRIESIVLAGGITTSYAQWTGTMTGTAREILGTVEQPPSTEQTQTGSARDWLKDVLGEGPQLSVTIKRLAATNGFAWRTVQRAKKDLGIGDFREGFGQESTVWWGEETDPRRPSAPTKPIRAKPEGLARMGKHGAYGDETDLKTRPDGWVEGSV